MRKRQVKREMKEVWPSRCKMQDERKPDKLSARKYAENPNWAKNNKNKAQRSREHVHHTEEMSVWQFVVSLAAWVCPLSAMKGGSKRKAGSSLIFRWNESKSS